jgi:hypothetical protein
MISRRTLLKGMVAGAAGLLIPERKIWALDQTMVHLGNPAPGNHEVSGDFAHYLSQAKKEMKHIAEREIVYGDTNLHVLDTRGWRKGDLFVLGSGGNREYGVVTGVFPMAGRLTIRRLEYT